MNKQTTIHDLFVNHNLLKYKEQKTNKIYKTAKTLVDMYYEKFIQPHELLRNEGYTIRLLPFHSDVKNFEVSVWSKEIFVTEARLLKLDTARKLNVFYGKVLREIRKQHDVANKVKEFGQPDDLVYI